MNNQTSALHEQPMTSSAWVAASFMSELMAQTETEDFGKVLTEQIRELSGAKTIILLGHELGHCGPLHVCPPRRADLFTPDELSRLCPACSPEELPVNIDEFPGNHPLADMLKSKQIDSIFRIPLETGGELYGSLTLLDLPEPNRIDDMVDMMKFMAPFLGIGLQNVFSRRELNDHRLELEQTVAKRTAELEETNRELQQSRLAALNIMEDAVQAREETARSEENLRITLNSIGDAVISTDIDGRVVSMNPIAESLTGWTEEDATGEPLDEVFRIINEQTGQTVENPVDNVLKTGQIVGLANHTLLIAKDGRETPIADSGAPIQNADGGTTGVVLVFRDQTNERAARRALEESEARLKRAQKIALVGDWEFDLHTGTVSTSQSAREIYGLPDGELHIDDVQKLPLVEYRSMLDAALKDLLENGTPYDVEFTIRRPSDQALVEIHSIAEYDPETETVFGVIQDITVRKAVELALAESREELEAMWNSMDVGIALIDAETRNILSVNPALLRISGYTEEEMLGHVCHEVICTNCRDQCPLADLHQEVDQSERELKHKDGHMVPIEKSVTPITLQGREVYVETIVDITERKKAAKQIEFERKLFTDFMNTIPAAISFKDLEGRFIHVNPQALSFFGLRGADVIGKTDFNFTSKEVAEKFREHELQVLETEQVVQLEEQNNESWAFSTKAPWYDENGILAGTFGISWDITERKRLQLAIEKRIVALTRPLEDASEKIEFEELFNLKEMQQVQDEFAAATGVASLILHPDGTPITEPSNFTDLCSLIRKTEKGLQTCHKSDALIGRLNPNGPTIQPCLSCGLWDAGVNLIIGGKHIASWLIGQVRDETQTDEQMLAYAKEIGADEKEFMDAFHDVPVMSRERFESIAQVLFTLANQLSTSAYQNIQQARFIADEKRRTAELQRLSTAIEQSPEAIIITDSEGRIEYTNPAFETITGYTRDEAIGQTPSILKSGQLSARFYERLWAILSAGRIWNGRFINKRKDGLLYTEEATISPVKSADGTITNYVGIKRDITQELAQEEQLQNAQKMEAVGQLAGGIAHDFNNILQAIMGFSELLLLTLEPEQEQQRNNTTEIQKAAQHAAELTRQLLAFSRKQEMKLSLMDINQSVNHTCSFISSIIGEKIKVITKLEPNLKPINGDSQQIERVLLNMALNARDAMPSGGELTLRTEPAEFSAEDVQDSANIRPGMFICLSISDTGAGMSQDTLAHIFEPFFTTKGPGKGTGLGLAAAYGIIQKHEGWINAYSEPDQGTTFKIFLPIHTSEKLIPSEETAEKENRDEIHGRGERILIVEDDPTLLALSKSALQRAGYAVETAETAEEAEQLFKEADPPFALLFSDAILPNKNGFDLAMELTNKQPNLSVLLSSGYAEKQFPEGGNRQTGFFFLEKPYSIVNLLKQVRRALKQKKQSR